MSADIATMHVEDLLARAEISNHVEDFLPGIVQHFRDGSLAEIQTVIRVLLDANEFLQTIHCSQYARSPEQAVGKPVDARSDIFSFGAVLYEMDTGRKAFRGDSMSSTLSAVLTQEPTQLNEAGLDVPQELEKLIARCLRKDRERRLQHAADLKVALLDLKDESDSGRLVTARSKRPQPTRRWWTRAALVVAVAVLAESGWLWISRNKKDQASFTVKPITSYPGQANSPSFSPDASQMAFSWNGKKQDNADIYVKLVDSGAPVRLTTNPSIGWMQCAKLFQFDQVNIRSRAPLSHSSPILSGSAPVLAGSPPELSVVELCWSNRTTSSNHTVTVRLRPSQPHIQNGTSLIRLSLRPCHSAYPHGLAADSLSCFFVN
jgi:serine/threonine protein kinase